MVAGDVRERVVRDRADGVAVDEHLIDVIVRGGRDRERLILVDLDPDRAAGEIVPCAAELALTKKCSWGPRAHPRE